MGLYYQKPFLATLEQNENDFANHISRLFRILKVEKQLLLTCWVRFAIIQLTTVSDYSYLFVNPCMH